MKACRKKQHAEIGNMRSLPNLICRNLWVGGKYNLPPETLFPHLWEIDETARRREKQIMTELLERNPAPDKVIQQLAWVQHMSSLKLQAEEIVNAERIRCNITDVEAEAAFIAEYIFRYII